VYPFSSIYQWDRNEDGEEEALNQLIISFAESHNSASYLSFARHRDSDKTRAQEEEKSEEENNQSYSSVSISFLHSTDCRRVIFEMYVHQWTTPQILGNVVLHSLQIVQVIIPKKRRRRRRRRRERQGLAVNFNSCHTLQNSHSLSRTYTHRWNLLQLDKS